MKTVFARLLLAAIIAAPMTILPACPAEEKKEDVPPPPPPPPPPSAPAIPAYEPIGDDAELKKEGAKDITADNAAAEAAKLDGMLTQAVADLEAKKAAAAPKK